MRPWWAERQLDPAAAAYAPAPSDVYYWSGDQQVSGSLLANTLGRSWTTVGLPETLDRAQVDPRGLVVCGRWSLDWWVRASDEWVFPSRAASVRQRLVDQMPVVETILRVGGGDVVHRVAAARGASVLLDDAERHVRRRHGTQVTGIGTNAVPEVFVVEIVNRTPAPVAVALAARPVHLGAFEHADGDTWEWSNAWGISEIAVEGSVMTIDDGLGHAVGRAAMIFDRMPGDVVTGSHGIDGASVLAESDADGAAEQTSAVAVSIGGSASPAAAVQASPPERLPVSVACPQHLANAAAVFPLIAGATLRAAVVGRGSAFEWDHIGSPALGRAVLDAVPALDRVANGWRSRASAGCRLELPSGRLADAALAAQAAQLLATAPWDDGGRDVGPMLASALSTDALFAGDDLVQLLALVESGQPGQVRDVLIRQAHLQEYSGETTSVGVSVTGSSLVLGEHLLSLHPDPEFAQAIGEFAASGARWLLTREASQREAPWTIREGLRAGYRLLLRLGAERAADALRREAMSLPDALHTDVIGMAASPADARSRRRLSRSASGRGARSSEPSSSRRDAAGGAAPSSDLPTGSGESSSFYRDALGCVPWEAPVDQYPAPASQRWEWLSHDTGLWIHAAVPWAPPLPFVGSEPAEGAPRDFVEDTGGSGGYDLVATALLAFAEARPAPARAFERLEALVSAASPTLNWPTFMHPQLRTGTNGTGHDLMVGGLFVRTLLRLLVDVPDYSNQPAREHGRQGASASPRAGSRRASTNDGKGTRRPADLRLAAHWPAAWLGQPVEVHDVPTRIGPVSWAVRWHGDRPALLWEVVPHAPSADPPVVTAPGLDPAFTETGWRGEALLAAPAP